MFSDLNYTPRVLWLLYYIKHICTRYNIYQITQKILILRHTCEDAYICKRSAYFGAEQSPYPIFS
jgi:hypothetical protein